MISICGREKWRKRCAFASVFKVSTELFDDLGPGATNLIVPKIVIMRAGFGNNRNAFVQNPGENDVAGREEEGHQEKKGWFETRSEQERSCGKAWMFIELMRPKE